MKYRTAAAIAMCLANGAVAAPTLVNDVGVRSHKRPHEDPPGQHNNGSPPQLPDAVMDMERRTSNVNSAELSDMIQNAVDQAERQPRQKRSDIEDAAVMVQEQTSRFTQGTSKGSAKLWANSKPKTRTEHSMRTSPPKPKGRPVQVHARQDQDGQSGGAQIDEKKLEAALKDKEVIESDGKLNDDKLPQLLGKQEAGDSSPSELTEDQKNKAKQLLKDQYLMDSKGMLNIPEIKKELDRLHLGDKLDPSLTMDKRHVSRAAEAVASASSFKTHVKTPAEGK